MLNLKSQKKMEQFLKTRVIDTLTPEEEKAVITFVKRWMKDFIFEDLIYNDFLYYVRLTILPKSRKRNSLHLTVIKMVEEKFKNAEALAIQKLRETEEKEFHHSRSFIPALRQE